MDRPPSFPHYQNPNLNFFHHCPPPIPNPSYFLPRPPPPPLQNPNNTYSIVPSPPPVRDLSGTLTSLQYLLSEFQTTLASLSQNLALDHSSFLQNNDNGGFVRCPFDSNHRMPPEALFLHSLRCPNQLDLTHLLESFSTYRKTLELPCELQSNNGHGDDLCFSLDEFTGFRTNSFYRDCPGAVNFSELDCKKLTLRLPRVLADQCSDFLSSDEKERKMKRLELLPSEFYTLRTEIDQWRDYPTSYSHSVLFSILSSNVIELATWVLVHSTRYGVIIDRYIRDHILLLFRLCLTSAVKEACGFIDSNGLDEQEKMSCKSRTFECPVLIQSLSWLASQLAVLYGDGNGKFFALEMFKQCLVESASRIMLFQSESNRPESSEALRELNDANLSNKNTEMENSVKDSVQVISMSRVAAAVAALYERSVLEEKIRAIRYPQPLSRYQRAAELAVMTAKAAEERKRRSSYRPIIDHDGLPRQRSSNQDMNKMKTREELLAEERDYKRRRMSYRGKKVKRTPRQVLRDMIEEFTDEIKLAGGIGCFEKGMPVQSPSSTGNDQKSESEYNTASPRFDKQWKGENNEDKKHAKRYEEYDTNSSQRQQSHRSYNKQSDRRDDSLERKSHHQNQRSSREKSSSEYKNRRDDGYDRSRRESRNRSMIEDRYNPTERK